MGDGMSGARVERVELSFDGGKTWNSAIITQREEKPPGEKVWSWVQWKYEHKVKVQRGKQSIAAMVRCFDSAGNKQDKTVEELFNLSGTFGNHPFKVNFTYDIACSENFKL